jgi:hypothetical protein
LRMRKPSRPGKRTMLSKLKRIWRTNYLPTNTTSPNKLVLKELSLEITTTPPTWVCTTASVAANVSSWASINLLTRVATPLSGILSETLWNLWTIT